VWLWLRSKRDRWDRWRRRGFTRRSRKSLRSLESSFELETSERNNSSVSVGENAVSGERREKKCDAREIKEASVM
jgi:hypothetical protein